MDGEYNFVYDPRHQLVLRDHETFSLYMNPLLYLKLHAQALKRKELHYLLVTQLQASLHKFLGRFLFVPPVPVVPFYAPSPDTNEGKRIYAHFPHADRLRKALEGILWYFSRLREIEATKDLDFIVNLFSSCLSKKSLRWKELARLISSSYRSFFQCYRKIEVATSLQTIRIERTYSEELYQNPVLSPISELRENLNGELRSYLIGSFVHGSYSTMDYCGYSDLDTVIILKREVLEDDASFYEFQKLSRRSLKYLYRMDPLQHHGHFVLTEYDLDFFPEAFFPIPVFEHSTSLFEHGNDHRLTIQKRDCTLEACTELWNMCYLFRYSYFKRQKPRNAYELKVYLSDLMLLPALYSQAKGLTCYKRESFELVREDFGEREWTVIQQATELRSSWCIPKMVSFCMKQGLNLGLNPVLISMGLNLLDRRLPKALHEILNDSFYERAMALSEQAICNLRRQGHV